jgi:Transposase DDE domain
VLFDALAGVYDGLGFDALGDEVFRDLVIARVVEPTSLLDTGRVLRDLGRTPAAYPTMKRTLARCASGNYRDRIAELCFDHALTSGDVSLCLYDVTTLYFEADKEDGLRKVGYSKERRVDPQIVVGLLVNRGGFPLEIGCFEGNKAEKHTILPIINRFQARHGIEHMVVVADAGMLSAANLAELDAAGLGFIVGSRVTKAPIDLESHFRWHGEAFDDGQIIDTLTPKIGANHDNDPALRAEPVWDPATHPASWRAVWAFSRKRYVRDNATLTQQENRARDVVAGAKATRTPRFVKTAGGARRLDEKALARARRLAGLKGCHQHPRHAHARSRGHRQLPRPMARRAVLPDEQDRPGRPAHVPPHPRRDRSALDHRVHRPGPSPRNPAPIWAGHPQPHPPATPTALGHHRDQRSDTDLPTRDPRSTASPPQRNLTRERHALSD